MKTKILVFVLLVNSIVLAQNKTVYVTVNDYKSTKKDNVNFDWRESLFTQADLSIPFVFNSHHGEYNDDNTLDNNWYLPNGLGAKIGYGIEAFEVLGVSVHTGIDWKLNPKMVVVPVYGNARLNIGLTDDKQVTLQAGYGKGIALGRGSLVGKYFRYSIGYGEIGGANFFAELSAYNFASFPVHNFGSISLGMSIKI